MKKLSFLAVLVWLLVSSCAKPIVHAPIDPYVNPEVNSYYLRRVAVFPLVVPDYLKVDAGAENISIDLTNRFISGMAGRHLVRIMDGETVKEAIRHNYPSARDWLFSGSMREAVTIARQIGADGVVFGKVTRYVDGNLSESQVEVEISLVQVESVSTIWSVRELVTGKGDLGISEHSTGTVPSARSCSYSAIDSANDQVSLIYRKGGPITVRKTSPRQIAGYSLISGGALSLGLAGYFISESAANYKSYQSAANDYEMAQYRDETQRYDRLWMIFGSIGLTAVGTGVYMLITDSTQVAEAADGHKSRVAVAPTMLPKGGGVVCSFEF